MINREVLNMLENNDLTSEDIFYLLNALCRIGTKSAQQVRPKVIIYLKSRTRLDNICREETARYLNMSSRTLSRKLQRENTGFHKLLDEERKRRCLQYLRCNIVCGQEITELLGLSDLSHFYRSFKQWTGHSFSEAKSILAGNNRNAGTFIHRQDCELEG